MAVVVKLTTSAFREILQNNKFSSNVKELVDNCIDAGATTEYFQTNDYGPELKLGLHSKVSPEDNENYNPPVARYSTMNVLGDDSR